MLKIEVGDMVKLTEQWATYLENGQAHKDFRPFIRHMFFVTQSDKDSYVIRPALSKETFWFGSDHLQLVAKPGEKHAQS